MNWLEIAVAADDEAVEAISEVLRTFGHGVAIDEPFLQPRIDEAPQRDPGKLAIVKTYLPDDESAVETQRAIEEALWHIGQMRTVEPVSVRPIAEEDWATAWKQFFPVLHVGVRTVVVPAWRRYRRREGDVVVRLDPGLAFGTGMHPTTRLCLAAAETLVQPGSRVLDIGTGSGILAIVAARLGAAPIVAVDLDPVAVSAARANIRLNAVIRKVRVFEGGPEQLLLAPNRPARGWTKPVFDVVLANVTARVNGRLAPTIAELLAPAGTVVASGILFDAVDIVIDAFTEAGLTIVRREQEGDWLAVYACKPG